jgi:putative thioredoxin
MIAHGRALGGQGESEKALEALLAAVTKDPQWNDGAARKAMIDLFEVLGNGDPLTREYRGKLSRALY